MNESINTIIEWHKQTFPDATLEGQVKKFKEEYDEYYAGQQNICELADMYIVACGIARFDGVVALEFFAIVYQIMRQWTVIGAIYLFKEMIDKKMKKNRKRIWNKTGNGTYHHENGIED